MDCDREDVRFIPSLLPRGPGLNHSESTAYFQPGRISDYVDARRPYRSNSSHLKNELSSLRLDILAHVLPLALRNVQCLTPPTYLGQRTAMTLWPFIPG